jgi:multiple sugar transport system permease protein
MIRSLTKKRLTAAFIYLLLVAGAVVFIAPLAWMVSTSLKPLPETFSVPPRWIPSQIQWHNYPDAIRAMGDFWLYTGNTLLLCVLTVIGTVLSSTLAAYGFARIDWPGRDKVFIVLLATMMIPFPVVMVPVYTLFKELGWLGTFRPLWVPAFFAGAFNVFLIRQFMLTIPRELSEAARIDGCNEAQILLRVILPLCKPVVLVVALFQFMFTWNDFLGPLIYLTDQDQFTLALALQAFQSQEGGTSWHHLMAASTLIILPVIVLFFFTQRYFIQGIATTGSKS